MVILLIAAIFAYPGLFNQDNQEKLRSSGEKISIVVLPFQNNTNDSLLDVWQDVVRIHVTDHDHGHVLGTVPGFFLVELIEQRVLL